MQVTKHDGNSVQTQLEPRTEFKAHASMDITHTSVVTSIADTTAGLAAMCALPPGSPLATLDLHVDYLKPASSHHTLVVDASCFKFTQNVAFVRGVVWQKQPENAVANINASFMLNTASSRPKNT